ncbi:MAG: glutathionylspermidine synthase family protein [Clostridia bacterium]|nr:glutathionylspermidine synthase family protein [Clostridia bacterium]
MKGGEVMKLVRIPKDKYDEYRINAIFDCYKWDPQFLDNNTVAKYALVITEEENKELEKLTEEMDKETIAAEEFLNQNLSLAKPLALPRQIYSELKRMKNYDAKKHIRLMRYDFHPTVDNTWAVSEVNSDVPGGFAEASLLPENARNFIGKDLYWYKSFGDNLANAIASKVKQNGRIMMVHCTCYSDDRQVMQYIGDKLESKGYEIIYGAADHVNFKDGEAYSVLNNTEGKLDGIFRFTPLEWLRGIKPKRWDGYFDTVTPSCNHPVAIFAQTKRFPLIWDTLEKNGIKLDTWRKLLPDTIEVKDVKNKEGYIFKPACGRVGEKISIEEACAEGEYKKILDEVKKYPKQYLAQKKFISKPLEGDDGEKYHVCLGSYTVEGKQAGYYARISRTPRIDSNAADIPVLIERGEGSNE